MNHRAALVTALVLLLVVSCGVPRKVQAAQSEVNGVFLFIDDYTNDSIVDAWAALNFTQAPIPPPSQVDDVLFEWFAPNGSMVHQETVDPNDNAWAPCSFRVTVVGAWTVNATYTTNTSVHESLEFRVLEKTWGPGQILLGNTTVVGRTGELTIMPGTQVRFPYGGALRVQGKLTAIGTTAQQIVFTSNASAPMAGDWNVISFLETADNSSRISKAQVRYSVNAIRLKGASPTLDNITFSSNTQYALNAQFSMSILHDLTIDGGAYGLSLAGSSVDIASVSITGANYGIYVQGGASRLSSVTVSSSGQAGIVSKGAAVSMTDSQLTDNQLGLRVDAGVFTAETSSFSGGSISVEAVGGARLVVANSSIANAGLRQYSASGNSTILARNVQLSPPSPVVREVLDSSRLVIQNYLRVSARDFDASVPLTGATVEAFDNGVLVGRLLTGAGGETGAFALTYGTYNATTFLRNTTTVSVRLAGYAFEDNDRIVSMTTSHVETFNGSIHDNDRDGDPDFSDPDDDNDGLSDQVELQIGTDPFDPDTDHDHMPDKWERDNFLDPKDPSDAAGDPDGDQLSNREEYDYGTDPKNPDSDGDGMPDGWEVRYGFNPLDASDANGDADLDGYTNLEEYQAGTNPRIPESRPPFKPDLGLLGAGDYWPIAVVPLLGLCLMVIIVVILNLPAVPRRRRRKMPPTEET